MRLRARRGVALAVAMFALVAVAALVHATVAPALAHRRAVTRLAAFQQAESLAEREVAGILRAWAPDRWRAMPVGFTSAVETGPAGALPPAPTGVVTDGAVTRLSPTAFMIQVRASVPAPGVPAVARRILFLEFRADSVRQVPALTLGGSLTAGASDVIETVDGCATDPMASAVVLVSPSSVVTWPAPDAASRVDRDSAALRPGTYARPAGLSLDQLRAAADVRLAPGAVVTPEPAVEDGRCISGPGRWGEPLRGAGDAVTGCTDSYPVIDAAGDLGVAGGRGQGILLVAGRLRITGPFRFSGIIVASGGMETDGGEVSVHGAVLTAPDAGAVFRAARTTLQGAGCTVHEAALAHAPLRVAPARAWAR